MSLWQATKAHSPTCMTYTTTTVSYAYLFLPPNLPTHSHITPPPPPPPPPPPHTPFLIPPSSAVPLQITMSFPAIVTAHCRHVCPGGTPLLSSDMMRNLIVTKTWPQNFSAFLHFQVPTVLRKAISISQRFINYKLLQKRF